MRVHQNIVIDGKDYGDRPSRRYSAYCNEGKWNNFIAPLLPMDYGDMRLIEIGSNAGLYLKMAKDRGFRHVMGIERDKDAYEMSLKYQDNPVINTEITEDFDFSRLPVADVMLLPNLHYHMIIQDFLALLDNMNAQYCLLVSVEHPPKRHWQTDARMAGVKNYFKDWTYIGETTLLDKGEEDPHPREGMYGILFESNKVRRIPINLVRRPDGEEPRDGKHIKDFIRVCIEGGPIRSTVHYARVAKHRKAKMSEAEIYSLMDGKWKTVRDIAENGQKKPIIVNEAYWLLDGGFRLAVLKELEYTSVMVRVV